MHAAAASSSGCRKDVRRKSSTSRTGGNKQATDLEELMSDDPKESKNWKSIFIALFVIVTVLGLVITAIVLVTPAFKEEKTGDKLTFKEFLEDKYKPVVVDPIWLADEDAHIYRNRLGELILFNCTANETSVFLGNSTFRELNTEVFKVSADRRYVLFQYDVREIYTHSRIFRVKIYSIHTKLSFELIGPSGWDIQYVTWSPVENSVIFVQENNIYYKRLGNDTVYYVTNSGIKDRIYNGVTDWLYGERVLQSDNTLWVSPNGDFFVYAEIDDTHVTKYHTTVYGDPNQQYTAVTTQAYPKAGSKNPHLRLNLFDLKINRTRPLQPPSDFRNSDHYVTLVNWLTTEKVLVKWLNRAQNLSIITICSTVTAKCRENFRYEARAGWVDTYQHDVLSTSSDEYFILLPQRNGPAGSFNQIASIDSKTSHSDGRRIFLTYGKSEVVKLLGYYKTENILYYLAIPETDTRTRHLYSIRASRDSSSFHHPHCLSCDKADCEYFDATFSTSGRYYVLECLGPAVPHYDVYQTPSIYVGNLESNIPLQQLLSAKLLPVNDYFNVPVLYSNEVLHAKLLLPPTMKREEQIKYRLLVVIDEYPGAHLASKRFRLGWEDVLSSYHDIIIALIDTRGSGGRGAKWRQDIYKNIGKADADDILSTTEYFKTLDFVHDTIAVYGAGYGGYISLSVLSREQSVFNCGLVVAPITDWRYMDSFYAERYMGSPDSKENMEHYNDANISKHATKLRRSSLMMMHGTGDKRVHFQNTAHLIGTLAKSGGNYISEIYPDADDVFTDKALKTHAYFTIEKYILQCFGLPYEAEDVPINENEEEEGE